MKKIGLIVLCFFLMGCTTISLTQYIKDKHPYDKRFYSDYDSVLEVTQQTLKDFGWEVQDMKDPSVYEVAMSADKLNLNKILIVTNVRQTSMFITSRYARMNIILKQYNDKITDVEIRYMTITNIPFKNLISYKQDTAVERFYKHVEKLLEK